MASKAPAPQLSKDEVRFLEHHMAELPTTKSEAGQNDADGLLKFSYHQNPYVRTFTKVLWSGFAISRGQLVDGSQRFAQARRDATVSAIDASTTKAMDNAAAALEAAMAPNGSIGTFLVELRDKTNQRLWARVCETAGLPPPSFASIMRQKRSVTIDELDADEEAEIAALRKVPLAAKLPLADAVDALAPSGSAPSDTDDDDEEDDDDYEPSEARPAQETPSALHVAITRSGNQDMLAEMLLAACGDALRDVRTKGGTGALKVTVTIEGQRDGGGQHSGGGHGKRRRRRR
jgi:hypothetical protein